MGPGSLALPAPRPLPPGPAARADAGPPVRAGRTGLGHHVHAPRPTCRAVHGGPRTGRSARLVVVFKGGVSLSRTSPLPRESRPAGRRALQGPSHAPAPRRHRCPAVSSLAQRPLQVAVTAGGGSSRSDPLLLPLFLHTAGKRSRPKGTSEVLGRRAGARGLSLRSLTGVGAAPARPTRGHCFFAEDCGLGAPLASLPQVGQEKGQRPALQRGVSPRGQQSRDPMLGGQREMTQTDRQTGVLERAWVVEPSRWPISARREGAWLNLHSGVPLPMSWSLRHMAR